MRDRYQRQHLPFLLFTQLFVLLLIIFIGSCAPRRRALTADEIKRKEIGVRQATMWNSGHINQIQHFNQEGLLVREQWFSPRGAQVSARDLTYNNRTRNLEKAIWYKSDGVKKSKYLYHYDRSHNLIREEWLTPFGDLKSETLYEYDTRGRLIEETAKGSRNVIMYKRSYLYDNENRSGFIETNNRGDITNRHHYYYDDEGRRVKEEWFGKEQDPVYVTTFFYENDLLQEERRYNKEGELEHTKLVSHDENSLLILERWLDKAGSIITENSYVYHYY